MILRLLPLPLTLPSRLGCQAADALAAGVDLLVRAAQRRRRRPPD